MIKFGVAGNSDSFYAEGKTATLEMPEWLAGRNLDVFEYSFGRGVHIHTETAEQIGEKAKEHDIEMSVHAPYYINFASLEEDKFENSVRYVMQSLKMLKAFGGTRCVVHVGTQGKQKREDAVQRIILGLNLLKEAVLENGYDDLIICPETMGKIAQIGTVSEIAEFCNISDNFYPCVDFGHINSREGGVLKTPDDFKRVIDEFAAKIGDKKTKNMHIHFSKIQYGAKGEIRHLTFEDQEYGPEFPPLAKVLKEYAMTPVIICESNGTQAEDAAEMKKIFNAI